MALKPFKFQEQFMINTFLIKLTQFEKVWLLLFCSLIAEFDFILTEKKIKQK